MQQKWRIPARRRGTRLFAEESDLCFSSLVSVSAAR
jgi:hypothetical protein